ncbi:integrin alpha-2-like [Chanos chanos]|uniref:Integrin alpha-2-like n=1 Tax=Chanos chanos TaxID=29144 RepID=A0A6J2UR62_CHACN|nr:integrin alpha-2-like [Chanos chanos]
MNGSRFDGDRFGFDEDRFGFEKDRFGFEEDRFGFGGDRFGFDEDRFGFGGDRFGFGGDRFGFEEDRSGFDGDRLETGCRVRSVWGFNVGTASAKVFSGPAAEQFGYTVQQFQSQQSKWLLVGSPWSGHPRNRQGDVYRCPVSGPTTNCDRLNLQNSVRVPSVDNTVTNMSLGLTLTPTPKNRGFMTCGPLWAQRCGGQYFYPGICAAVSPVFSVQSAFAPALQTCGGPIDIVIVLDGSNSIYPWTPMNDFLQKLLPALDIGPGRTQVSVVQYAVDADFEFRLRDYRTKEEVIAAASRITQRYGHSTNTFHAVDFAVDFGFLRVNGGRPEAAKIMVVVTDGESHDRAFRDRVIAKCDEKKITRFGIAVLGHYIRNNYDTRNLIAEIKSIASAPTGKYFFNVSEEAALSEIAGTLGNRIFNIEGTGKAGESFQMEMAQVGFSAHYAVKEDVLMLGAVGAYAWSGTVVHKTDQKTSVFPFSSFQHVLQDRNHSSLLGYSVTSLRDRGVVYYVAGAPRSNHSGQVIVYTLDTQDTPTVVHSQRGEQIGSYFGSVVCAVDVDQDDVTDVLLVGAPMFMSVMKRELGRVYLFTVTQGILNGRGFLNGPAPSEDARFGTAVAPVSDVNLDGFGDVVVGAPLEEDGRGVVYVYNGDRRTIRLQYSQRIPGSKLDTSLQYFGRSLDGGGDLNDDAIPDVSVGALGKAVQLWSRGVATVTAEVTFTPDKIDLSRTSCDVNGRRVLCFDCFVCFRSAYRPRSELGPVDMSYKLTLDADLHSLHVSSRGLFTETNERFLQKDVRVGNTLCLTHQVYVQNAPDFVNPLGLRVDVSDQSSDSSPALNIFSPHSWEFSIPFAKLCGSDLICVSDLTLRVKTGPETPSKYPVTVSYNSREISFEVLVRNLKENAYNTQIFIKFSSNLFYASVTPPSDGTAVHCSSSEEAGTVVCRVGYPALRKDQQVKFMIHFDFNLYNPQSKATVEFEAKSEGREEKPRDNKATVSIPLRYNADVLLTKESTLDFYEVSKNASAKSLVKNFEDIGPEFKVSLKVSTVNFPVSLVYLTVSVPVKTLGNNPLLYITGVSTQTSGVVTCSTTGLIDTLQIEKKPHKVSFSRESFRGIKTLDCKSAKCSVLKCVIGSMRKKTDYFINMTMRIWNSTFVSSTFESTVLTVNADIQTSQPNLLSLALKHTQVTVQVTIRKLGEKADLPKGVIVGSVIGGLSILLLTIGLLWKLGFFKRKYKQLQKEAEEEMQDEREQDEGL